MANTPLGTPQGVPSSTDFLGSFKPPKTTSQAIQQEGELISNLAKATQAEGEAAGQAGIRKAELQAPIVKQEAESQRAAYGQYKSVADQMQDLEFKPTQESLMSLTGIASLTAVIGLMLGKTGGFSGQSAIDSMTGMMKGYQAGKADIFKQEQAAFEKNVQAQKANLEKLKGKLDTALKMASTNRQAAEADIAVSLAEIDSDFLKAKYNKEGLKGLVDSVSKLEDAFAKRDQLSQKAGLGGGKIKEKEQAAFNLRNSLIPDLEEALPVIDRLEEEGNWKYMTSLLGVDTRAAEYAFSNDPEALKLIRTLAKFRSKEFETGGKSLTAKEDQILRPLYQSGFRTYEATRNAVSDGIREMKDEQNSLVQQYPQLRKGQVTVTGAGGGKTMPTGDRLKAYAEANFDGDETKAKQFLKSQGYTE